MRLLHTSDWQIGKAFGFADDATREVLRDARLEAISRLGRLGQESGAAAVLVAGDIYDVAAPSDRTLRQPIERMRQFPGLEWHLIPGNHDPHTTGGPWERLRRGGPPENVHLHLTPAASPVGDGAAWIVPAPLTRRHAAGDPTEAMDAGANPRRRDPSRPRPRLPPQLRRRRPDDSQPDRAGPGGSRRARLSRAWRLARRAGVRPAQLVFGDA